MQQMTAKEAEKLIMAEGEKVKVDTNKVSKVVKYMKQLVKSANKDQLAFLLSLQVSMINQTRVLFHQKLKTGLWTPGGKNGIIRPKA